MSVTDTKASGIITNKSLQGYFFDSVNDAVHNQQIDTSDEIIIYLVNLLTTFSRSEDLFHHDADGVSLKPLALMYSDALAESRPSLRIRILQKLGDTALFIAGVFSDSLNTRLVDMDYYVAMGGNAYACISDNLRYSQAQASAQQPVYEELRSKFVDFVDVLSEVTENKSMLSNHDIMRLYEVWMRTGSKRTEAILKKLGIEPIQTASLEFQH
ncbi:MAG: hypothetical protein QNJ69_08350 [Gammaproteobacteria bacterium]|nr:hypothetical protein [Gammaproteobacteria bacterium]